MGKALIFCGIKHCGKSTLGRITAELLGVPFCDTDQLLEEKHNSSVRDLYRQWGEEEFRRRESDLLQSLSGEMRVISLGGGALLKEENHSILQKLGTLIWCDISDETAFERISKGGPPPFLAQAPDPFEEFKARNRSRRETFARLCRIKFSPDPGKEAEENGRELLEMLKRERIAVK